MIVKLSKGEAAPQPGSRKYMNALGYLVRDNLVERVWGIILVAINTYKARLIIGICGFPRRQATSVVPWDNF